MSQLNHHVEKLFIVEQIRLISTLEMFREQYREYGGCKGFTKLYYSQFLLFSSQVHH